MEILPIITFASEIAIDSYNGYIYWSTTYTIQFSLLNGQKRSQQELFRANEIRSITVDSVDRSLYWTAITSVGQSTLYKSGLMNEEGERPPVTAINSMPNINIVGPVASFASRMFWLDTEQKQILISDSKLRTFATVQELNHISAFDIVDTSYPLFNKSINVVPFAVDRERIMITGSWDNFTLRWEPVKNVNYGQVFYDLVVEDGDRQRTNIILNRTIFHYSNELKQLKPYSMIKVAIRSFTYWASAKQVVAILHTPTSTPSKPLNVRVFTYVTQNLLSLASDQQISWKDSIAAEARWSPPEDTNGLIQSYAVSLWTVPYPNKVTSIINKVIPNQLSYRFDNLNVNSTYYFEVRATTDSGEGAPSDVYQFKTFYDDPPSRLLLSQPNSILLTDMDLNRKELVIKSLTPLMVDYIYNENILYWIEEGNFLKRASLLNGSNYHLVAHLHEQATGLTVDWIGRRVYIATVDHVENKSTIWHFDHSNELSQLEPVVSFYGKQILSLKVNPFDSQLVWTEMSLASGDKVSRYSPLKVCKLINSGTKCNSVRDVFTRDRRRLKTKSCNCTYSTMVGQTFALDYSNFLEGKGEFEPSKVKIVYYDQFGKYFSTSDLNGCFCRRLTSTIPDSGVPVSMTIDSDLYWTNGTDGAVNRILVHPNSAGSLNQIDRFNFGPDSVNHIISYNIRNQPYVDFGCLIPHNIRTEVSMLDNTAYSLTLRVQHSENSIHNGTECGNIASASLRYRVRYRKQDNTNIDCRQDDVCQSFITYNNTFTISDLEPFTNYTVMLELDNYYLEVLRNATRKQLDHNSKYNHKLINNHNVMFVTTDEYRYLIKDDLIFATAESRPGPPRNVRTIVETPEKILVLWDTPEKLNTHQVSYEVRWYSVESSRKSLLHTNNRTRQGSYFMYLENIKPGKEYNVTVRAYAVDNHQYSDSDPIVVRSYETPSALRVSKITPYSITLNWLSPLAPIMDSHQLFMQEDIADTSNWTTFVQENTRPFSNYEFKVKHLKPNTKYRFQLMLIYKPSMASFSWPRKVLIVSTRSSVPDTPFLKDVQPVNEDESNGARIFKLNWDPVNSNSDDTVYYALYECLKDSDRVDSKISFDHNEQSENTSYIHEDQWNLVYNGTETYWIVSGLESGKTHQFRLVAWNSLGSSNYSPATKPFYLPFADDYEMTQSNENVLIMTFIICSIFTIFFISILIYSCKCFFGVCFFERNSIQLFVCSASL